MLQENRQITSLNIVLIGQFNPVIIQPFWLSSKQLIKEEEATTATVEIIHSELVKFRIGDWLGMQITRDRFELHTTLEPYFEPLRDLTLGIFDILKETPLTAIGLNHILHYSLNDEKLYHLLGDKLAPLNNWDGLLNKPEILSLEVVQRGKENMPDGSVRIRIQPSDTLKQAYSFMININDHYSLKDIKSLNKLLNDNWSLSFKLASNAEGTIEKILKK